MTAPAMRLGRLKQTHPCLDIPYVRQLRALYKGGCALLNDREIMARVFPRHAYEGAASYEERCSRAFYENNFGQVIGQIVAGLGQDPIKLAPPKDEAAKPGDKAPELDDYWKQIQTDCTPPDDDVVGQTLDQFARAAVCEALVTGRAWVNVDMPPPVPASSEREQVEAGALRAYPVLYQTESVVEWEETKKRIAWVRTYCCENPAPNPWDERTWTVHTWRIWTDTGWVDYELALDKDGKDKNGKVPDDDAMIPVKLEGEHRFGRVPWVCFDAAAPDRPNIWIGDAIESQCRNLFNEQCGDVFLRLRAMFQQLYEFLGKESGTIDTMVGANQKDPDRARPGQRRAPDVIEVRGQDDDAKFIAPDMAAAEISRASIKDERDGIMRVSGQLALQQDTSGAMLRRSGDSKKQDKTVTEIVLGGVGKLAIAFMRQVVTLMLLGRKDTGKPPEVSGYERFDVDNASDIISDAAAIKLLDIQSARFQIEHEFKVAHAALGDNVDPAVMEEIRENLEAAITQEKFTLAASNKVDDLKDPQPGQPGGPPAPAPVPFGGKGTPPGKKAA